MNGNGLSQKILLIIASAFGVALVPFFIWLGRTTVDIQARMESVEAGVGRVEKSIERIDKAATTIAAEERVRAAGRIAELEREAETRGRAEE